MDFFPRPLGVSGAVGRMEAGATIRPVPYSREDRGEVLNAVTTERVPKFRAGKAFWHPDRKYQDYEGCFLPLSSDGITVNIVFGGVKVPGS